MNLKLKEILWEITPKCNRNCDYCGSKQISNCEQLNDKHILDITDNICCYMTTVDEPKNITLTGGEPLLLGLQRLQAIVRILKNAKCSVSTITNGDLLTAEHLELFDSVGISVNTEDDVKKIIDKWLVYEDDKDKMTFVTNFGLHNVFEFDNISNFIKNIDGLWQIQLTMGDGQLDKNGIKHLYEKINNCNTKYVLADNLQVEHNCMAGLSSMGITFNGFCVPCISARAWGNINNSDYNILKISLRDIWEDGFKNIRFSGDCDNCRKHIDYPKDVECCTVNKKDVQSELEKMRELIDENTHTNKPMVSPWKTEPDPMRDSMIMMYAAFPQYNYTTTCKDMIFSCGGNSNDDK